MKLYEFTGAPNPRRVRVFLAEKGIHVPFEQVDIMSGAHKSADFAEFNPIQRVPVLVLNDGTAISESMAICRYFEAVQPDPPLFGKTPIEIGMIEMWNRRMEFHVFRPVTDTFRNSSDFFKGRIPQVPEYVEVARRAAEKSFTWLDEVLGNQRFIAGDKFTIADITALCAVDFARVSKIRIQPAQQNLARWREEVSARPSAKA